MKYILGKKVEMTQRFAADGRAVPVTAVVAGPCVVTQVKQATPDGYNAVQLGFSTTKHVSKPVAGHLKGLGQYRFLREFRMADAPMLKRGDTITAAVFKPGDTVDVVGISKGKGFQGVVRRHGFAGGPATHGDKDQHRMPGSIGATNAQRVFKGTRMGGHMGDDRVTVQNLEVIEVDAERGLLYLSGAVPGARHGLLLISGVGEMDLTPVAPAEEAKAEAPAQLEAQPTDKIEEKKEEKPGARLADSAKREPTPAK